jgi:hypothetical protein
MRIGGRGSPSITATVPYNTNVTALKASFTTTGDSVTVNNVDQTSGQTANDFTSDVDYVVHAADASTQTYTVTVNVAANTAKDITSFQFLTVNNAVLTVNVNATITGTDITAILPSGTAKNSLIATFATTGDTVYVAINRSDSAKDVSGLPSGALTELVTGQAAAGPKVSIPARQTRIFVTK